MTKVWIVCARLKDQEFTIDNSRVVAAFEDEITAVRFVNEVNDSKPLYEGDMYYYVEDQANCYTRSDSMPTIRKIEGIVQ